MRVAHRQLSLETGAAFEAHDITPAVTNHVARSGVSDGLVQVASLHTTAAVTVNEFEPGLMADLERWLRQVAPAGAGWRHDALARTIPGEPENTHAHLAAMLLGRSQSVAVENGRLKLGTWQRIILVELDGPRRRTVTLTILGSSGGKAA